MNMLEAYNTFLENEEYEKAWTCLTKIYNRWQYYDIVIKFRERIIHHRELLKETYRFCGRDHFDDFMIYCEWNRPLEEKFWLPRRSKLMPICNALQELEDGQIDELFLSQPPRTGKALANDTPILTRNGWKNHGDLVVGDEVIGMDGKFKRVIAVHPKCNLDVLVEFTNGEKVQCHENHEWLFYDRGRFTTHLEETKYWEKRKLTRGGEHNGYILQLPFKEPIVGEEKELPIDPYTFGVWLGDGANKNPRIANAKTDYAIIEKISKKYPIRWSTEHKTTGVMYYDFDIRKELQSYGLCHSRKKNPKYIPDEFLTASKEQRLELLAGLLDTDGTLVKEEHRYKFTTSEETLRDTFIELISTFGWRCCTITYKPNVSSSGIVAQKEYYTIGFNPDCYIPCALERKQLQEFSKQRAVAVKSITRVAPKEGNCITVEGGMYLCGKTMIPTHNTTLILFFLIWIMLRNSERSNLYCSYTDSVVKTLYNGIVEVLTDKDTYLWQQVFPESILASTDAKDLMINIDRKKRYASFTGRSLYGTLNGACDCDGYAIADDLISGIEEAMNKDRLTNAWLKVENNFLPRAKQRAKILWIGTRWSLSDPIEKRIDVISNEPKYKDRRYKLINVPALDENDESNFEYACGVGFNSEYYQQRRASFERNNDMASWLAQYQGTPIERDGAVFAPDDFRYYNGAYPDADADRIFMVIDPAWGGGDYVAGVIVYQYGNDLYIADVVYNNSEKDITQAEVAGKALKHKVSAIYVEGTKMTSSYGEGIDKLLKDRGYSCNVQISTKHFTGTGKEQRIFDKAPDIREKMLFLSKRDKEYEQFMQNVFSFTMNGKNKHDDAPDCLAMTISYTFFATAVITVKKRTF